MVTAAWFKQPSYTGLAMTWTLYYQSKSGTSIVLSTFQKHIMYTQNPPLVTLITMKASQWHNGSYKRNSSKLHISRIHPLLTWVYFFHGASFINNTTFPPPLCETLYATRTKFFAKRRSSSHMPCFILSPTKPHPRTAFFRGSKPRKWSVLNRESDEALRTWFIFLFGWTLQIHFNFFKVCPELIVATLSRITLKRIPSLSQKTLAITLHTAVCTKNLFSFILPTVPN